MSQELISISDSNIQAQVAVARSYPRDLKAVYKKAVDAVWLNQNIAESCIYAFKRGGKMITGPSIRLAEIMLSSWGHMHSATKVVGETADGKFIEVQAIVIDRENNNIHLETVQRSIMTSAKDGKTPRKFDQEMIGVTASAAASIALRRAAFRVIGAHHADELYEQAKKAALGQGHNNVDIREKAISMFEKAGISSDKIFKYFQIEKKEDLTQEHLEKMVGIKTSIKQGLLTKENAFSPEYDAETGEVNDKAKELNDTLLADNSQEAKDEATEESSYEE